MKNIFPVLLLLVSNVLFAQEPDHDAEFIEILQEYTLHEDGSQEYHYYKKLKLNTHFSFNRLYGETFIVYNPDYQELIINQSKTTHSNGKVTMAPFNSFNEVLPAFASDAPHYNHLREMVVTHPGTEINAVIELDYTLKTKTGFLPGLMADEILPESSPLTKKTVVVKVPAGTALHYKVLNLRTAPEIDEQDEFTVYRFTFGPLGEISQENHQPNNDVHLPRLILSTLTWDEVLKATYEQMMPPAKSNEKMKTLVSTLRKDNPYDLPFILKLTEEVAGNINNYSVPAYFSGYRSRSPIETWESNGGTALEKSYLLATLLKEQNINSDPVIVVPTRLFDPEIGCPLLVSEILVQASPRELEQMYISASKTPGQNMVFNMNGNTLITLRPDKPAYENINSNFENKVITNGTIIIDDSMRCAGNIEILLTEAMNPFYLIETDSNAARGFISGFGAKEIAEVKIINNAQYRSLSNLKVKSNKPLHNQASYYFFELPQNKYGTMAWHMNYLSSERQLPFRVPAVINEQYSYEITVPANTRLVNPLELKEIKTPFGELVLYTRQKGDKITVKRMLVIHQTEISAEFYPDFKMMVDLWNEENFRKLVLAK